jgi:hypothetical protein
MPKSRTSRKFGKRRSQKRKNRQTGRPRFTSAGHEKERIHPGLLALRGIDEELPWAELEVPPYREGAYGKLVLERQDVPKIRGYFRGMQGPLQSYRLIEKGLIFPTLWMSTTPMERESQMAHLAAASGHIVIVGCGMGVLLYNVLKKPEVHTVTLIEKNAAMTELLGRISPMADWHGIEKLRVLHADALNDPLPNLGEVDLLSVDIWPVLGEDHAIDDTRAIFQKVQARRVAWWGMELDFVRWHLASKPKGLLCQSRWSNWGHGTRMPVISVPVGLAYRAQVNMMMGPGTP